MEVLSVYLALLLGIAAVSTAAHHNFRIGMRLLGPRWAMVFFSPAIIVQQSCVLLARTVLGQRGGRFCFHEAFCLSVPSYVRHSRVKSIRSMLASLSPVLIPIGLFSVWLAYPIMPQTIIEWFFTLYALVILSIAMGISLYEWRTVLKGALLVLPVLACIAWCNPAGLFSAPPGSPWDSPAARSLGYLFGGAFVAHLSLPIIFWLLGRVIPPSWKRP